MSARSAVSHRDRPALGILLAALLVWPAGASGVLAGAGDQGTERLAFATGRSVAYLSTAPLRGAQPQVEIAVSRRVTTPGATAWSGGTHMPGA